MKKNIIFGGLMLMLSAFFLSGCDELKNESPTTPKQTQQKSAFIDDYLESDWLNFLPDQKWDSIQKENNTYSYKYREEIANDSKINKSITYQKTDDGKYKGMMTINFSGTKDSHVINLPKSFASHVDEVNFSIKPKRIINPDPIVEFENTKTTIEIESNETKDEEELKTSLEEQILETEYKRCEELKGDESIACSLSLIARHRDSEELKNEISKTDMTNVSGASIVSVFNGNMRSCKYIKDRSERQRCYEYTYQTLVDECHKSDGKEYRTCVRNLSNELPSFEEQRLFCGHIDDKEMREECQGVAPVETCNEIEDKEMRDKCKLNIARTNGDIKICDKVEDSDYKKVCVAIIGITNEDENYCDKIKDYYISGQCRVKLAMQKNDKNICMQIKNLDAKDLCLGSFLTKEEAISQKMCNEFHELFLRETCELALAVINNDQNKCADSSIISLDNQAICYFGIAIKHGDLNACKKIISFNEYDQEATQKLKEDCLKIGQKSQKEKPENKQEREQKSEEGESMNCSEVSPAVCPMNNKDNNGATIHLEADDHDVQCTYYNSKEAGYPLYNELYKLDKKRDGSYKQYYKSGNIQIFSEHKNGKNDGFRINCNEVGALENCMYYQSGSKTINCMP